MKYEQPSAEQTGSASSPYGEPRRGISEKRGTDEERGTDENRSDERVLYGEPCHEVGSECDEQTLYGEPQHETREESRELPDVELLFARMRAESASGPTVLPARSEIPARSESPTRSDSSTARSTE